METRPDLVVLNSGYSLHPQVEEEEEEEGGGGKDEEEGLRMGRGRWLAGGPGELPTAGEVGCGEEDSGGEVGVVGAGEAEETGGGEEEEEEGGAEETGEEEGDG